MTTKSKDKRWSIRGDDHKFHEWIIDQTHKKETLEDRLKKLTKYSKKTRRGIRK